MSGLTQGQVQARGLDLATENPATGDTELVNTGTGALRAAVQTAPDPGFASNPGKDWWRQTEKIIRERLQNYPLELAQMVEAELGEILEKKTP